MALNGFIEFFQKGKVCDGKCKQINDVIHKKEMFVE